MTTRPMHYRAAGRAPGRAASLCVANQNLLRYPTNVYRTDEPGEVTCPECLLGLLVIETSLERLARALQGVGVGR